MHEMYYVSLLAIYRDSGGFPVLVQFDSAIRIGLIHEVQWDLVSSAPSVFNMTLCGMNKVNCTQSSDGD